MTPRRSRFSIQSRIASVHHALRGLLDMVTTEPNAWVHAIATVLAIGCAWWLRVGRDEFVLILLAIVGVWMAEAFNTVLELMADLVVGQRYSRVVKRAKDIAAAAVLITSFGALTIGIIILGPGLCGRIAHFWK